MRGSACRTARSAVAAAIRRFNGSPLKLCSVSRRPHGSDSLPERRFRISRRLTVLRSRALSARREFCLSWFWLFTWLPSCLFGKETPVFSLWLTARTTNCPSTLKKGVSQSKSLLNDRVHSLFGRSLEPLLSSGRQLPPLLLLPAPRRFLPLSRQPFSPLAPLFFNRALSPCFFVFLYAGVVGGFGSPLRPTCPHPAACRLRPTLRIVVSPVRAPSVCLVALSPLCPDVYTPNGFVFRTTTPCDPFRPRAGFPIKQITALAALCLQPRRDQPLSPPPLRPAYRQGTVAHKNHLSSSSCVRIGCRRPALVFTPGGRAPAVLPFLLPPARFFCLSSGVARRFVVGRVLPRLVAACVAAAARGQRSEIGRERGKQAKIGFFALNRAKTR